MRACVSITTKGQAGLQPLETEGVGSAGKNGRTRRTETGRPGGGSASKGLKGRWEGAAKATDGLRTAFRVNNATGQSEE